MKDVLFSGKVGGTEICQIIVNSADLISLSEKGELLIQPMHHQTRVLSSESQNEEVNVPFSGTRMYNVNSI